MSLDLTVIVPAFNEAHRLADGMDRFTAAVDAGGIDLDRTEVVVIDDGSSDQTAATARKLLAPLPHHRVISLPSNRGKGAAVRTGVAAARGAACAYMDADMAIDPRSIPSLMDGLRSHDIAIGSRALADSMVESRYLVRSLMGNLFNRLVTTGTGLGLHDTQCGFKAFRTPVARLLFHLVRIERFAFDVDVLIKADSLGLVITQVPVHWKHVPGSSVHPLHDSLAMLRDVYGSRLGLRAVPPVTAIAVSASGRPSGPVAPGIRVAAALAEVLPATPLPVLDLGDGDTVLVLVLAPLLSADEIVGLTSSLASRFPELAVSQRTLTLPALRALGPLAGRFVSDHGDHSDSDPDRSGA